MHYGCPRGGVSFRLLTYLKATKMPSVSGANTFITDSMLRVLLTLIVVAAGATLPGCAYPNQYQSTSRSEAHATLTTVNTEGWFGGRVIPFYINQQPTAFWRVSETFRLRPGRNEVIAVYGGNAFTNPPRTYQPLRFDATPGGVYVLRHAHRPEDSVYISDRSNSDRVVARAIQDPESCSD